MTSLPSVAVSTILTNPLSSQYYSYLAFLESWGAVVDEIILVDGGSTDKSFEIAKSWVSPACWEKIRVVNSPRTFWGADYAWHALQAMHNYHIGLYSSSCDWVVTVNADNVLYCDTAQHLRSLLAQHSNDDVVYFYRGKPINRKMVRRFDTRATAVNFRRIRSKNLKLGFGVTKQNKMGYDFAILSKEKTTFIDPQNAVVKTFLSGVPCPDRPIIDIECGVFGHFFFDINVVMPKLHRWDRIFSRYMGTAPCNDHELKIRTGINNIECCSNKNDLLIEDYPYQIKRVITEYYRDGMIGGALHYSSAMHNKALNVVRKTLGIERNLRSKWLRIQGYRGLVDYHKWVALDAPDPEPVDVKAVYMEQDKYLPPKYRIDWGKDG